MEKNIRLLYYLPMERMKIEIKKSELEKRIEELERLVKELIEYKQDKEVIIMDKNWKPLWYDIHDYKPDF